MNQSILFPDIQSWKADSQQISFPAQQAGALIECIVHQSVLARMFDGEVANEEQALAAFSQLRFDLEDLAEELIEEENFNGLGQIEII
ncbi:DUF1488 domain-containing protein [Vibrio tapetis]|uniref:Uncharacterized protein n=1 Tax=Vibrio tapetis subsp. tapetis TaxID=1671868 RepID=A0A2N8ZHC4_9VIBR|nr:DUF1488 domain-containing protein [Vibrio tapetis]SON51287.1 conserved protein of unknown function [Vibrio tapetis subsp. tapetis]